MKTFVTSLFAILAFTQAQAVCPGGDAQNDYVVHSRGCHTTGVAGSCAFPIQYREYYDSSLGSGCAINSFFTTASALSHLELISRGAAPHDKAATANTAVLNCISIVDPDGNNIDSAGFQVSFHAHAVDEIL